MFGKEEGRQKKFFNVQQHERKELLKATDKIEKICKEILGDPLGIQPYKEQALADKTKRKE